MCWPLLFARLSSISFGLALCDLVWSALLYLFVRPYTSNHSQVWNAAAVARRTRGGQASAVALYAAAVASRTRGGQASAVALQAAVVARRTCGGQASAVALSC